MNKFLMALAASCCVFFAGAAQAAVMIAKYTGSASVTDNVGMFGLPAGHSTTNFIMTFTYDTDRGQRTSTYGGDLVHGGHTFGDVLPVSLATLTINGHAQSIVPTSYASAWTGSGLFLDHHAWRTDAFDPQSGEPMIFMKMSMNADAPIDLETPFSGFGVGYPANEGWGVASFERLVNGAVVTDAWIVMTPFYVTITSAVPEPSIWILSILGFGVVGASLRSVRARSRLAATH